MVSTKTLIFKNNNNNKQKNYKSVLLAFTLEAKLSSCFKTLFLYKFITLDSLRDMFPEFHYVYSLVKTWLSDILERKL